MCVAYKLEEYSVFVGLYSAPIWLYRGDRIASPLLYSILQLYTLLQQLLLQLDMIATAAAATTATATVMQYAILAYYLFIAGL
jgi:hypothetical protein